MSRDLTFVFLCEGSSDSGLSPHLESLLVDFGATKATGMVDSGPGKLASRLKRMIAEESQFDLIFIHRDSDGPDRQPREEEIRQVIRDSGLQQPHVPVIPVQEMEAWLLLDESSIRQVSGNPNGRSDLGLPKLNAVEKTKAPKEVLKKALQTASKSSSRRKRRQDDFSRHRRILLQRLDTHGQVTKLDSWQRLERDIQSALAELGIR